MNRDMSIDTIRVSSVFLVILAHYSTFFEFGHPIWIHFGPTSWPGTLGVLLFFGISGYLMGQTLEKKESLKTFYRKKFIRLFIPWIIAYVFMSIIDLSIGIINHDFFSFTPISSILWNSLSINEILNVISFMVPYENHLMTLLSFNNIFVGEWFVGTLFILYLISPLLYRLVKCKVWYIIFACFILLGIVFYFCFGRYFVVSWWFFIARIPDFILGMLLYYRRELLSNKIINLVALVVFILALIKSLFITPNSLNYINNFLPQSPELYMSGVPIIYFSFRIAKAMQNIPGIQYFNRLAPVGYAMILLQHTIIYMITSHIFIPTLNILGYLVFFMVDIIITIRLSNTLYKLYTPIENYLITR